MKLIKKILTLTLTSAIASTAFAQNSLFGLNASDISSKVSSSSEHSANINQTSMLAKSSVSNTQLAMSSPDYMVTAGDIYSLSFAINSNAVNYVISVDSSYKVRVANLTVLDVSGKTFLQFKRLVEQIITQNYPMSGVQLILTTPAVFNVTVKGEVTETAFKQSWALTRLSEVIQDSLTNYSSDRNVTVTSSNGTSKTYDLFKAKRFGELDQNPFVRPGDVITVNRISRKVNISGAVERPGEYTLLENENAKSLIEYYGGGFTDFADYKRIEVSRQLSENTEDQLNQASTIYITKKEIDNDFELFNYDNITVYNVKDISPIIFVEGAISTQQNNNSATTLEGFSRIALTLQKGDNYAYVIRKNKNIISSTSDLANAYVIRGDQHIPMNIAKIIYDANYFTDVTIQDGDILLIPFKQHFVSVAGAVNNPGRYPYIPDRTWDYYVGLAGGINKEKNSLNTVQIRDINGKELDKNQPITPETTITASTNSFLYFFNKYAPVVTTILSVISTSISVLIYSQSLIQ